VEEEIETETAAETVATVNNKKDETWRKWRK
jgi:hypothetical protein